MGGGISIVWGDELSVKNKKENILRCGPRWPPTDNGPHNNQPKIDRRGGGDRRGFLTGG